MNLLALAALVLGMLGIGLVLFHALGRQISPAAVPSGTSFLLIGPLPGIALLAILVTLLSLLHLVRAWFIAPFALVLLAGLRRDTLAVAAALGDAGRDIVRATRRGDLFPLVALLLGIAVCYTGLFLCMVPGENVDIWAYHLPLARSIVEHHGFVYPQIEHPLYGTQPIALEMLHGAGMTFVNQFATASAINLSVYLGLVALLLSFARRARGFQFLVLCYLFVWHLEFYGATTPMIDAPRSCLSLAAFLFAYRYACTFQRLNLFLSALMAGFAVAAKTTELITPIMISVTLAPLIWRRGIWRDLVPAAAIFVAIASYWYIKNLILYGNPVYPFLFGHPGFSDSSMRDYMQDMSRPFDIADRVFSTNLLTWRGWHDFIVVMRSKFLWLSPSAFLALLGLILPLPRRWMLPLWSLVLFVVWYAVMFNSVRWATTAVMLLTAAAFLVFAFMVDQVLEAADGRGPKLLVHLAVPFRQSDVGRHARLAASLTLMLVLAFAGTRITEGRGHFFLPFWMDDRLRTALSRSGDPEKYLNASRPDYEIYRYIGRHNLGQVFQPYDNGAILYASAYNDGQPNRWILPYQTMPARIEDMDAFLASNHIRYFVRASSLSPVAAERLGLDHVALADRIVRSLEPHSRLVIADRFGNSLYEIELNPLARFPLVDGQ
jgi:hypothetical protein